MKYEVRLQVIPDDESVQIIPAFYLLDAEHFDKIAASCAAHALPPEVPVGVPVDQTISETPAPVFEPPTATEAVPETISETAPEATHEPE